MSLSYLRRDEWGAVTPTKWNKTVLPIMRVYHISTNTKPCYNEMQCIQACQQMQALDISKNRGDIMYSFVIGGDGQVYEGRGWNNSPHLPKSHRDHHLRSTVLIGYVGRWKDDQMPPIMIRASGDLIDYGIENKYLSRDYRPKQLFHDEYTERVVAEFIKESTMDKVKKEMRTINMVKEMGLKNEIVRDCDDIG